MPDDSFNEEDEQHESIVTSVGSPPNLSASTSWQAVIVDEENPEVEAIKAENKRLRQSMIAENRRRRHQMENNQSGHLGHHDQTESTTAGEIIEATPTDESGNASEGAKKRTWQLFLAFLCLFLAIVGAIGAVFAWSRIASSSSKSLSDEPASSPSSYPPSSPPTITMLYDPPSEEDCLAIENGEAVSGQDTMIIVTLDVGLEIVLNKDIAQNEWMDQLLQSILAHLIPYLVGCTDDGNPSVGNRYVFGNANATIDYDDAETCEKETDLPCYPVAVRLDLTVKDDEEVGSLIKLLETLIGPDGSGDSLADKLHLSDDFNEVILEDITNQSPKSFPSSAPTDMPSSYPSTVQSSLPSLSSFTPLPTLSPIVSTTTSAPTKAPTVSPSPTPPTTLRSPTRMPTRAPALGPTEKPSTNPSSAPTDLPSDSPSTRPSETPSATPTESLSAIPTQRPTNVPSRRPTSVPTSAPPTVTPSAAPTSSAPSSKPSSSPSVSPSKSPTTSPQPSVSGFYWVACGAANKCSFKPATIQNTNYSTLGGTQSTLEEDLIAVRCCSEILLPGYLGPMADNCPYAHSTIAGACYNSVRYYEAESLCKSVGARLCTLSEIENNCALDTGCGHNQRMVWTSTPASLRVSR